MGQMIDVDEFINHTRNLAEMASKHDDKSTEAFFQSVIAYTYQYIGIFEQNRDKY